MVSKPRYDTKDGSIDIDVSLYNQTQRFFSVMGIITTGFFQWNQQVDTGIRNNLEEYIILSSPLLSKRV